MPPLRPCRLPGIGVWHERLPRHRQETLDPRVRCCRIPEVRNPDSCGCADRTSDSVESVAELKSVHPATGSSRLHCSSAGSSGLPLQPVLVMESVQNRLGHHAMASRNIVTAEFGSLIAGFRLGHARAEAGMRPALIARYGVLKTFIPIDCKQESSSLEKIPSRS